MTSYIMAIDQGTTSTRAILFDKASNIVGVAQKEDEVGPPAPGRAVLAQKHSLDEKPRTLRN